MEKINNKEAIALIITLIINNFVFVSSQILIQDYSSASLINTIYICLVALLIGLFFCFLLKKFKGQDILDISQYLGGKTLKFLIGLVFLCYFLIIVSIMLRKLSDCLQIIYYPLTNIVYIILLFIITTGIICHYKNNAISKAVRILLPLFFFCLFAVLIGDIKHFDYQAIYPIFGYGIYTTFISGLSSLYGIFGLGYILFLPSKMRTPEKLHKVIIGGILLSSILCIVSIIPILLMFNNSLSEGELFPLYIAVRFIEFGSFFQRLDSAFLMIAVISFTATFSIVTEVCIDIFKKITRLSDNKPIIYPILLYAFSISSLIKNSAELNLLENNVSKILFFVTVIGIGTIILFLANIKRVFFNERNKNHNE